MKAGRDIMPSPEIEARVRRVVAGLVGGAVAFDAETRLHEDLGLDWVHLVELTGDLEDEFCVPIPECELIDHLATVGDLTALAALAVEAGSCAMCGSGARQTERRSA